MAKNSNKKNKKDNNYNAENEIIIGVTTKPKENVRVDNKKATRTNTKPIQKKTNKINNSKKVTDKKNVTTNNKKVNKKLSSRKINEEITKERRIKKINRKKIIVSITILLLITLGGTIYYLTTPVFNISNINIYGNEKNSVDTYISLSQIKINETNIFAFTKDRIEKRLKENAYVEVVDIKRKLPNTLELHITEREVAYQIKYSNNYIYLDKQGYILEINEEKQDVPTIKGLSSIKGDIKLGKRLDNEDLIKLDTILKVVNYCKYNSIESKLTGVNVTDTSNYILEFAEDGKTAHIGDSSSITEKMTSVAYILEDSKGKSGTIYADENALKRNRVYFSKQEEEK